MSGSNTFAAESVGFGPVRIRHGCKKLFPVASDNGNITSSGQHRRPGLFITVFDGVGMHEQVRQIIIDADVHGLAGLHKGVEESGNLRTGFSDVEQPVLSSHSERPDCVLGSLVAACGKRIIKEERLALTT